MKNILYVPIIKWKEGEIKALNYLSDKQKNRIIPLIEILDYYEDPNNFLSSLAKNYPYPVFVDTIQANDDERELLISIIEESVVQNLQVFPILYYDDFENFSKKLIQLTKYIAIRIPVPEDIEGPSYKETFEMLENFYKEYPLVSLSIILDLGVIIERDEVNKQFRDVKNIFEQFLLNKHSYNAIIISLTSFPKNLSSVSAGKQAIFPRFDVKLFSKLLEEDIIKNIQSKIIYSDYGVTRFTDTEIDFSKVRYILPKIRYTTFNDYVVWKGERNPVTHKITKYSELARELIESEYYLGENFSYGDLEIMERAKGINKKGPGNHANWVTINTNHHIAVVVEQLSKNFEI